ncbi:MAG TPA: hypothetical protein VFA09_16440, partial [Ktedonobacteraceae bacterium]|nr:hypothetical protein [Ktedonobacteraceae bacterium]
FISLGQSLMQVFILLSKLKQFFFWRHALTLQDVELFGKSLGHLSSYELAYIAGLLRTLTKHAGLSLGDRCCLALAQSRNLSVFTTDRQWANLSLDIQVRVPGYRPGPR